MDNNIDLWSKDERIVVRLLLELPRMILDLEAATFSLPFTWGCKRRRSAIQDTPTPCPPAPPLHHGVCDGGAVMASPCDTYSPATPLSFPLTESDDKTKKPLRRKASLKRKREYYLKVMEDLTESKASLNQEIESVKRYSDQLKAYNLKLKARKEELSYVASKVGSKNPSLGSGWPMQLVNTSVNSANSMFENQRQRLQLQVSSTSQCVALMINQTCGPSQISNNEGIAQIQFVSAHPQTTSLPVPPPTAASPSPSTSKMGPLGFLDLNASPEELTQMDSCQPLDVSDANKDLNRAMAAQARQRRIQINRLKNPIGNSKARSSYR